MVSPRLLSRTLLAWVSASSMLHANPTQEQIRTALGSPPELTWNLSTTNPWGTDERGLLLGFVPTGSTHFLETSVTGPGVIDLGNDLSYYQAFKKSVWVDGVRSGPEGTYGDGKVAVGPGSHTVRWQAVASGPIFNPSIIYKESTWEPFVEVPLATAAAGNGVTLSSPGSSPWIGQSRWHHGDGAAAWSGVKFQAPPIGGAIDAPLRADFTGPGVLSFQVCTQGYGFATYQLDGGEPVRIDNSTEWSRIVLPVGSGSHQVTWRADLSVAESARGEFEMAVDDVSLRSLVPLAEALDTPELTWTAEASTSGQPAPFGMSDPTSRGGSLVIAQSGTKLSTTVAGPAILKVRVRKPGGVSVYHGSSYISFPTRLTTPLPDGWEDCLYHLDSSADNLTIYGYNSEIDFIEVIRPPTVASALGLAEGSFTTGGHNEWGAAPYLELGGYGAGIWATRSGGDSWLDLPVTGPAELRFNWKAEDYNHGFGVLVDGRELVKMDGYSPSETIRLQIPAGNHTVRWLIRPPGSSDWRDIYSAQLAGITIQPLPADGGAMGVLGLSQPLALSGEWAAGSAFPREHGGPALQAPPAGSTEDQGYRDHAVRTRFQGPGELSFWWHSDRDPAGNDSITWKCRNPLTGEGWTWWEYGDPAGWNRKTLWLPPGDWWFEWSASGSAEDVEQAALDDIVFTPSPQLSLAEATGAPGLTWATGDEHPWTGVQLPGSQGNAAVSPQLLAGASAHLKTTVTGPGTFSFRWKNVDSWTLTSEFHLNGDSVDEGSWQDESGRIHLFLPLNQPADLEWLVTASSYYPQPEGCVGVQDVAWEPLAAQPLAGSLDAPAGVIWTTSPENPFIGADDSGAVGGTSAYAAVAPGEETWIEATVKGAGLFDFWLREVPGISLYDSPWDYYWSLTVDGQPVAMTGATWQPLWLTGTGIHHIRLTLRYPEWEDRPAIASAVDQVSWQPLKKIRMSKAGGHAGLSWKTGGKTPPAGYSGGGRDGGSAIVLQPLAASASWAEAKVQGPCELSWDSAFVDSQTIERYPRNSLQINDHAIIPLPSHAWQRHRLTLPAGSHIVRWYCDPWTDPDYYDGRVTLNTPWQLSGFSIRKGISPLAGAVDAPGLFALETGDTGGMPVISADEDAWEPGVETSLYFFDPRRAGTLASTWGRPGEESSGVDCANEDGYPEDLWSDGAAWEQRTDRLKPGGFARWSYRPQWWWDPSIRPPLLASLSLDTLPAKPLGAALESPATVESEDWTGRKDPDSKTGGDSAWSLIQRHGLASEHEAEATFTGPARLSFWWRHRGSGRLTVSVDGGLLPVPTAGETWTRIELALNSGQHVVRWQHESGEETSAVTPSEAWLDGFSLKKTKERTMDQAASVDAAVTLSTSDDVPLSWHTVGHAEADGSWTEAVRALSGSRVLKTTVTGPSVLSSRVRCFAGLPAEVATTLRQRLVAENTGGVAPTVLGHLLAVQVDGNTVVRVHSTLTGSWENISIPIPEGSHEISFKLMTRTQWFWFNEQEIDATQADLQGWIDDIRLEPYPSHFTAWAANQLLPVIDPLPGDDSDGDGASNELEYWFGTAPGDSSSSPPLLEIQTTGRGYLPPERRLMIPYLPFHSSGAVLESSSNLVDWQPIDVPLLHEQPSAAWLILPSATSTHHSWVIPAGGRQQYFRLRFPDLTK